MGIELCVAHVEAVYPPPDVRGLLMCSVALLAHLGCQGQIGDACERSFECSPQGDRTCDLSHRVTDEGRVSIDGKGECTIDGCGRDSCPTEAACIKVYGSEFLSVACDPQREDLATQCDPNKVGVSEAICEAQGCQPAADPMQPWTCPPLDACDANETCLPEGLCVDEITARTSCRRKCSRSSTCRSGYECRLTGTQGIYRAPSIDEPDNPSNVRICMPIG